jgi:hypothetical protein
MRFFNNTEVFNPPPDKPTRDKKVKKTKKQTQPMGESHHRVTHPKTAKTQ